MSAWPARVGAFALMLVLVAIGTGWVLTRQQSESVTAIHPEDNTTMSERTTPSNTKPAMSLPAEDVPGRDVPDLPRYPDSVRVEYERKEQNLLVFTRVMYLSHAKLDVIRGFYRGVFRAEGWKVANVEFSDGEWTFLVVHGEREAEVRIEPHRRGVTRVVIELSDPLSEKETAPKETPPKREAKPVIQGPAPPQPSQSATPTPQSASPAPAPQPTPTPDDDYYRGGGEDGDDLGDDGGGD